MDYKTQRSSSHAHITDSSPTKIFARQQPSETRREMMMNLNLRRSSATHSTNSSSSSSPSRIIELMLSFDFLSPPHICVALSDVSGDVLCEFVRSVFGFSSSYYIFFEQRLFSFICGTRDNL